MKYSKPAITFSDQAEQLLKRGLVAQDKQAVIEKLQAVSYCRLSAYWYPFRQPDGSLAAGTSLEMVWRRYTFDRQLRLLVLDAIERVEIAVRSQVINRHSLEHQTSLKPAKKGGNTRKFNSSKAGLLRRCRRWVS